MQRPHSSTFKDLFGFESEYKEGAKTPNLPAPPPPVSWQKEFIEVSDVETRKKNDLNLSNISQSGKVKKSSPIKKLLW